MHRVPDSNSCPPDLELGALTKWLASRMLVCVSAGFSITREVLDAEHGENQARIAPKALKYLDNVEFVNMEFRTCKLHTPIK